MTVVIGQEGPGGVVLGTNPSLIRAMTDSQAAAYAAQQDAKASKIAAQAKSTSTTKETSSGPTKPFGTPSVQSQILTKPRKIPEKKLTCAGVRQQITLQQSKVCKGYTKEFQTVRR